MNKYNYLNKIKSTLLNNSYEIGSILSLILTIIPFIIILEINLPKFITKKIIILCSVLQIIVHFSCFLHIDNKKNRNFWNEFILLFTIIIVLIIFIGSLYIMFNLNKHMFIT